MANVPEDLVLRGVEDVVQRDGELDDAEAGPEVAAGLGDVEDDVGAELVGELLQLLEGQVLHVDGVVHGVQQRRGRPLRVVLCLPLRQRRRNAGPLPRLQVVD